MDTRVSVEKFKHAVSELRSAQDVYSKVWEIKFTVYPNILIDIMSGSSGPSLTLALNLQSWDFLPPAAAYMSINLRRHLSSAEVPASVDDPAHPIRHIVEDDRGGAWPCSPGFLQYHILYPEDSWQLIRGTDRGTITWIVERACNMVDRKRLRGPII